MTTPLPPLLCVAHGTRHGPGNAVAVDLARQAGSLLGVAASAAYVELCAPLLGDAVAQVDGPTVAVPLLLSTGFHVRVDLPHAVAGTPVTLGDPLGPSARLARAQADRLRSAGALQGQPVLLVAAGSRDPGALPELARAAALLEQEWSAPVTLAALSGPLPRPDELVTADHAVSPYLLAPGFFADRAREESARAAVHAGVIGPHPEVAALVAERYADAARRSTLEPAWGEVRWPWSGSDRSRCTTCRARPTSGSSPCARCSPAVVSARSPVATRSTSRSSTAG